MSVSVGTTSVTATASGTGFLAYYISVQNYAAGNAGIGNGHTAATNPCVNSITTTAGIRSGTVFDHAVVRVLTCDSTTHPDGKEYTATFGSSGVQTGTIQTATVTPGSGAIRIHEYTSVDGEMQAFQAGIIDTVDWDVPAGYLNNWNNCASTTPIGPNCNGQITTSKYNSFDKYEIDMNENGSRVASQLGFRQAMGYLVDRQNIVLNIAGGFVEPICAAATPEQEGGASCQSLGYPSPYGDYNPTKALQVLYESGWRYDSNNGFLYGPALPAPIGQPTTVCSSQIPGQTGNFCVRTIIFITTGDDSKRLATAQAMANIMQNLPNQFCNKTGGNINPIPPCSTGSTLTNVCPAAPCKLDVTTNVASFSTQFKIIRFPPWNRWDLWTGGHIGELVAGTFLPYLYGSENAPKSDCGSWLGNFPSNYGGFCNSSFDAALRAILNVPTPAELDAAALTAQQIAWGYSTSQGKITGLEPTVPTYSDIGVKAAWLHDVGGGLTTTGTSTTNATFSQRACRQGIIGNEAGEGVDAYETLIGSFDDNCAGNTPGHVSYLGNPNSVLDYGLFDSVEILNPVASTFAPDFEAMAQTYDTLLGNNPANPSELKPALCSDYSIGTYFNTPNNQPASYFACHLRTDLFWSDGVPLTAQDVAFSTDYAAENQSPLTFALANLCGPNFTITPFYSPTNCGNGVQIVNNLDNSQTIVFYFDSISATFPSTLSTFAAGVLIIPKHVYCNDWTGPLPGKLGPGVQATGNCLFPDMFLLPNAGMAGLSDGSCTVCPAFPGTYPNGTLVPIPSYLSRIGYGSTIKNWQTGSGPYKITSCGGGSVFGTGGCGSTILLTVNPYWHDGVRMASPGTGTENDPTGQHGGLALQPDLNRDGFVNSQDLAIAVANGAGNYSDWRYSADFRQTLNQGNESIVVPSSVCGAGCTTPTIAPSFIGWSETSTDVYIIEKLIREGVRLGLCVASGSDPCASGGISWPPPSGSVTNKNGYLPLGVVGSMSYIWPDSSGATAGTPDGTVNVNDLIYVFTHQFVQVTDTTGNLIPRSPYNADVTHDGIIDIHDLIATLTREFTQPAGVVP